MNQQLRAISAEWIKHRHAGIRGVTFVAFALAPVFGAVFMFLMKGEGVEGLSGAFRAKAALMSFEANWNSYLGLLAQAVGVGGVLIFGFVASWLFGREYADDTAKDLLALPISRARIIHAKFVYYALWCFALAASNGVLGLLFGVSLQLDGWSLAGFLDKLGLYLVTTLLVVLLNTPIAFFALWGRGYLVPLGVVALILVLAQLIGAMGLGTYFPWAVPGIYSGSGGEEMKAQLNEWSFILLLGTSLAGYAATVLWWKYADQH